jgi:hypothetical protein
MECDFNLLCYGLFKIPKVIITQKALLNNSIKFFLNNSFVIFLYILKHHGLKLEMEKNVTFNII